jgi:hypothetical protein
VEQLVTRCERIYDKAMLAGELVGAVGATRELRGCLELLGKLSGELQNGVRVGINIGDITKIDIKMLTDEQLEALYARLHKPVGHMTNEEINAELRQILGPVFSPDAETLREVNLFDEETVPPGLSGNHVCWGGIRDATGFGPGWTPYRNSSPADRFQMLQVAWKRFTGVERPARVSMQDLGPNPAIVVELDLADPREEYWHSWPKVRLMGHTVPEDSPALPAKTLEGSDET